DLEQSHQHEEDHEPDGEVPEIDVHVLSCGRREGKPAVLANVSPPLGPYKGKPCALTPGMSRYFAPSGLIRGHASVGSCRVFASTRRPASREIRMVLVPPRTMQPCSVVAIRPAESRSASRSTAPSACGFLSPPTRSRTRARTRTATARGRPA